MLKRIPRLLWILIFIHIICQAFPPFGQTAVISPELKSALKSAGPNQEIPVIITLADQEEPLPIPSPWFREKRNQRSIYLKKMKEKANLTQKPLLSLLKEKGIAKVDSLWIINSVATSLTSGMIEEMALRPEIESIRAEYLIFAPRVIYSTTNEPAWNIKIIQAQQLWENGYKGQGVVVANMDTGVDVYHPDLREKWRGGKNSWFDPSGRYLFPMDRDGHGTQSMAIMVGGSSGGSPIGIAPEAQWIAVKIFNDKGEATTRTIHLGFQWLLDPDGDPETDDAPDIVNNSWGLEEGKGECILEFLKDIEALKAAGIAVVFSAGNGGPSPLTNISPANYPDNFAVGAIGESFEIADFSSQGPSVCDGTVFPEVVAPGINILTADLTHRGLLPKSFVSVSGTSFSSAHVAGGMALLKNAFPSASIADLESALKQSCQDLGKPGPDNTYGYGLINLMEAYNSLSQPLVEYFDLDSDGFDQNHECNDQDPGIYPGAPEIKNDHLDQDCNGYDLTISITKAVYMKGRDLLYVEAISNLGQNALLELTGYGPMKWNKRRAKWSIYRLKAGGDPGVITVVGIEGLETVQTSSAMFP